MGRKNQQQQKSAMHNEVNSCETATLVAVVMVILAVSFSFLSTFTEPTALSPPLTAKETAADEPKETYQSDSQSANAHFPPFTDSPYSWLPLSCPAHHTTGASGFDTWLKQHGATAPKISIAAFTNEYYRDSHTGAHVQLRGMAAIEEIAIGEQIVSIPQVLLLSTDRARTASDFGLKLAAAADKEAKVTSHGDGGNGEG